MKSRLLLVALLFIAGCAAPVPWAFDVDREEGVHGEVQVEWWYHWGFLTDETGREWACFSSFFRAWKQGLPVSRYQLYDLEDLKTGERRFKSAAGSEVLPLVQALTGKAELPPPHEVIPGPMLEKAGDPLKLKYGADSLERLGPRVYRLKAGELDLELKAEGEAMAVEGTGLTGVERPEQMHYYTIPRLTATGTVRGKKATGIFWYDHQWGETWTSPTIGWSWWGLQLDDGSNLNAYVLRDLKTGAALRAVATHDRRVYPLVATPRDYWTSPTKVRYPVAWDLKTGPLDLRIDPMRPEREVPVLGDQQSIWEGPVRVSGSHGGRGFQELVSYARERRRD